MTAGYKPTDDSALRFEDLSDEEKAAEAAKWSAPPSCDWCGAPEFRTNLDGDNLCQACADAWVRGEGIAAMEHDKDPRNGQ